MHIIKRWYNNYGDKMQECINGVNINYTIYGNSNAKSIVFLHGWGQNIEMMEPLADPFKNDYQIVILDLPGFGKSTEPTYTWTIYDYVKCLNTFLNNHNISSPILVGHSFGGKLALLYASTYDTSKLVVLASPFKKEIAKLSLKTKVLKQLKKIKCLSGLEEFAKKHIGSVDYRNASPIMRQIMTEHLNTDITEEVKKIKCPTLIIWGTNDEAVPYERALELEKLIDNAGVVTYEGCTHYAYLERLNQTINVLKTFFDSEE